MAWTRAEALKKLLSLGDLVMGEIVERMGGDVQSVLEAVHDLTMAGELTYRNCGRSERLYCLSAKGAAK